MYNFLLQYICNISFIMYHFYYILLLHNNLKYLHHVVVEYTIRNYFTVRSLTYSVSIGILRHPRRNLYTMYVTVYTIDMSPQCVFHKILLVTHNVYPQYNMLFTTCGTVSTTCRPQYVIHNILLVTHNMYNMYRQHVLQYPQHVVHNM